MEKRGGRWGGGVQIDTGESGLPKKVLGREECCKKDNLPLVEGWDGEEGGGGRAGKVGKVGKVESVGGVGTVVGNEGWLYWMADETSSENPLPKRYN